MNKSVNSDFPTRCVQLNAAPDLQTRERDSPGVRGLIIIGLRTNRCEIALRTRLFASLMFRSARPGALALFVLARDYLRYERASRPIRADEFIVREVVGPGIARGAPLLPRRIASPRINPFFASLLYVARAGSYDENRRTWVCLYRRHTIYQVTYPLRHVN